MFRSSTNIRELALNLAKVIFMLKHSVKLRRYLLRGCVTACGYVVTMKCGDICEDEVPGWVLKSKSTNYPDHGHHGHLPLPGKIPMVEPGVEPGTP